MADFHGTGRGSEALRLDPDGLDLNRCRGRGSLPPAIKDVDLDVSTAVGAGEVEFASALSTVKTGASFRSVILEVAERLDADASEVLHPAADIGGDGIDCTIQGGDGELAGCYAFELEVGLINFTLVSQGDDFGIEVAAYPEIHPQAKSAEADLQAFATKVKAGADSAITQYFYNSDAYFRFLEDADKLGVHIPVVPGIMPITSSSQLLRFSDACGAEIPRWIRLRLQGYGDDIASIKAFGLEVVTDLCDQLRAGGAPGLHFYSMNQSASTLEICKNLGLTT